MSNRLVACLALLTVTPSIAASSDVVINDVFPKAPVIVYELPEADGRADVIRYVESVRDELKKGTEIIDASAGEAVLKNKLRNGFILYTTLGEKSKLLRLATPKLGWQISGGTFHWRDVTAPAADVKFTLVGRNPYGKGRCAIYAAGSNGALVGIKAMFQERSSYYVFQKSQLLREGNYDENFVSHERISHAAALEDVNQFFKTLERVHPHLLTNVSPENYRKLKQQTSAAITGEMAIEDLASLLYYAGASFQDGHTAVYWQPSLNEWNTRGRRFPAFRLQFDNGRFVIAAAKDPALQGRELVGVNGVPVMEFLRPILDRCSGETLGFRAAHLIGNQPFWYYLTNLFPAASYTLKLREQDGQEHEAPLETLSYPQYQDFLDQGGAPSFRPNREGTKVEYFDSGATAHFLYSSFHSSAEEHKKVDAIFQDIAARGARNLILDVRGNPGGQSDMGEQIFSYLYSGKFRVFRMVLAKTSLDVLPQVPWWGRPILVVLAGHVISHSIAERAFRKPAAFFSGHTYLLTDNGSFSMATAFATMFRDYKVGTTLGYETGGRPNMFGGPHQFTLKNSRIGCIVAWTQNLAAKPWPGDDDHGVIPDVPLSEQKLADFKTEQDPVLAFTLHYINSR